MLSLPEDVIHAICCVWLNDLAVISNLDIAHCSKRRCIRGQFLNCLSTCRIAWKDEYLALSEGQHTAIFLQWVASRGIGLSHLDLSLAAYHALFSASAQLVLPKVRHLRCVDLQDNLCCRKLNEDQFELVVRMFPGLCSVSCFGKEKGQPLAACSACTCTASPPLLVAICDPHGIIPMHAIIKLSPQLEELDLRIETNSIFTQLACCNLRLLRMDVRMGIRPHSVFAFALRQPYLHTLGIRAHCLSEQDTVDMMSRLLTSLPALRVIDIALTACELSLNVAMYFLTKPTQLEVVNVSDSTCSLQWSKRPMGDALAFAFLQPAVADCNKFTTFVQSIHNVENLQLIHLTAAEEAMDDCVISLMQISPKLRRFETNVALKVSTLSEIFLCAPYLEDFICKELRLEVKASKEELTCMRIRNANDAALLLQFLAAHQNIQHITLHNVQSIEHPAFIRGVADCLPHLLRIVVTIPKREMDLRTWAHILACCPLVELICFRHDHPSFSRTLLQYSLIPTSHDDRRLANVELHGPVRNMP